MVKRGKENVTHRYTELFVSGILGFLICFRIIWGENLSGGSGTMVGCVRVTAETGPWAHGVLHTILTFICV